MEEYISTEPISVNRVESTSGLRNDILESKLLLAIRFLPVSSSGLFQAGEKLVQNEAAFLLFLELEFLSTRNKEEISRSHRSN